MHFTIEQRDGVTVFTLNEQRLDSANAGQLKAEFLILAQPDVDKLIVDLSKVSYVDSAGLSALLLAERQQSSHGGDVRLVGANEHVKSLLRITQLDRLFPMYNTVTEAIEADLALEASDNTRNLGPNAPSQNAIRSGAIAAGGSLGAAALAGLIMDPTLQGDEDDDEFDDDEDIEDVEDDLDPLDDEVEDEADDVDEEEAYSDEDDLDGDFVDEDIDEEDDLDDLEEDYDEDEDEL